VTNQAAEYALNKYAAEGDEPSAEKAARLLMNDPAVRKRFDAAEVISAVKAAGARMQEEAITAADALEMLTAELASAPGTVLIAVFTTATASAHETFGRLQLGPAAEIIGESAVETPPSGWDALPRSSQLAIRIDDPAPGARGRRSAFQSLRGCLGGLYLAASAAGSTNARIGPVPADDLSPAAFVGPSDALTCLVQALRSPAEGSFDASAVLELPGAREIIIDCVNPPEDELVGIRMRDAAPWIQLGFDALTYPDAVLSLGIALECLIGSENASDPITQIVSKRAGYLLREGRSRKERVLTTGEWRDKTKNLYEARSKVAHGRYREGAISQAQEHKTRSDFEALVTRVALAFRKTGRTKKWMTDADLRDWQEQLEMG